MLRDNAAVCACRLETVSAWRAIARNVEVYLYGSHNDYWAPSPTLYENATKVTRAHEDGATQVYSQISGFGGTIGSDLVHLRSWLTARLTWDPAADVDELVSDFCHGYYGPAGDAVLESIRLRHEAFAPGAAGDDASRSPVVAEFVDPPTARRINELLEAAHDSLDEGAFRQHLGMAWIPYLWTDFWLGYEGVGGYDAATATWAVPMADGEARNRYGVLAKRFMVENGVNALGERERIDPRELGVEKMGVAWPAHRLRDGAMEVVIVPEVGGLIAELRDTERDFAPLKACWGGLQLQYPLFSSTEDNVNGVQVTGYEAVLAGPDRVVMQCLRETGDIAKSVALADGGLEVELSVTARETTELSAFSAVMLDLLDEGLGTHPTLSIHKTDGTWDSRVMGAETTFWWVDGEISLDGTTGEIVLASATRPEGVRLTVDPEQVSRLSFWYDRKMDYYPEPDQHGMLRLFLSGSKAHKPHAEPVSAAPGESISLAYRLELLPDAGAVVSGAGR